MLRKALAAEQYISVAVLAVGRGGFEPKTPGFKGMRTNRLAKGKSPWPGTEEFTSNTY